MSKIEWTDETWNPVCGCSKVSPGCDNCYAERMAYRLACMGQEKYRYVTCNPNIERPLKPGGWTGEAFCDEKALEIPLHWRNPRQIFVCSMGDLFHKSVPFEFIDKVMSVIALCPQHTFQVLTKRPERMLEYIDGLSQDSQYRGNILNFDAIQVGQRWPLKNLWLGVTAENQEQADKRIPILLQIPAAVRFVSIEPMLGAVDIERYVSLREKCFGKKGCGFIGISKEFVNPKKDGAYRCPKCKKNHSFLILDSVDWVIVGGESGPGARYCSVDNIRGVVNQCQAANVPVFVKQIHMWQNPINRSLLFETVSEAKLRIGEHVPKRVLVKDINLFPKDLQIREHSDHPKGGVK